LKTGLLLAGLMLAIVGCTTTQTASTTLASQFALSMSTGAFR